MIVLLWHRWSETGNWKWLLVVGAVLVADILVGSALISWELRLIRDAWGS